jgi:uncharacterized protein (DUF885 family)
VAAGRLLRVSEGPSPVFGVADRFVRRWAELEPSQGLMYGLAGTPGRLSDWSPEGRARVADAFRQGLAELDRTPPRDGPDRRAAAVMGDRLQVWLASTTAQDWARELDAGFLSPPAMDRMALATAPLADAGDAELLASRLTGVPAGMQGYAVALRVGLEEGRPGAGVLAARLIAMLRASARSDGGHGPWRRGDPRPCHGRHRVRQSRSRQHHPERQQSAQAHVADRVPGCQPTSGAFA